MTAGLEKDVRTYMMVRSCSCRYVTLFTHVRQDGFGGWTPGDVLQHDGGRMEEDTLQEVCMSSWDGAFVEDFTMFLIHTFKHIQELGVEPVAFPLPPEPRRPI